MPWDALDFGHSNPTHALGISITRSMASFGYLKCISSAITAAVFHPSVIRHQHVHSTQKITASSPLLTPIINIITATNPLRLYSHLRFSFFSVLLYIFLPSTPHPGDHKRDISVLESWCQAGRVGDDNRFSPDCPAVPSKTFNQIKISPSGSFPLLLLLLFLIIILYYFVFSPACENAQHPQVGLEAKLWGKRGASWNGWVGGWLSPSKNVLGGPGGL